MKFKTVIFAADESSFLRSAELAVKAGQHREQIIWADSRKYTRTKFVAENSREWLLFLDHDCLPEEKLFKAAGVLAQEKPLTGRVFVGHYLDGSGGSWMQRAHNFIANTWLEQSYLKGNSKPLLLGGIFMVYTCAPFPFEKNERLFWGAEDKLLALEFSRLGFEFLRADDLCVPHNTSSSFLHFVRRAFLHGKNEVRFIGKGGDRINYLFWIRKIGFANSDLLPLILLHFCIQKAAVLIQRVLPQSK